MKTLMLIALVAISISSSAQTIRVFFNGQATDHQVKATSEHAIFTESGQISDDKIDSIQIVAPGVYSRTLMEKYGRKDWKVKQSPIVVQGSAPQQIEMDFDRFRLQRNGGKLLQLAGVAGLGLSSFLSIQALNYNTENAADINSGDKTAKEVPGFLPWAALGAMGVGIMIDMDAGKHLKRRRR